MKVLILVAAFTLVSIASASRVKPVQLELYYESLCPGCRYMITKTLNKTYSELSSILDITFVPYGNARELKYPNGTKHIVCQHGPEECVGNKVENCALHYIRDEKAKVNFITCLENKRPNVDGKLCAKLLGMESVWPKIDACTKSKLGDSLVRKAQQKTESLRPQHTHTPWVVINGGKKPKACIKSDFGISYKH
ncbi:Gamma-interferon-inducible lysosomal thiol reductase [Nymphon striatum]|nr:Gamma-interferon-inducible lysosomal thiol reductase [Nymphon striatum]